MEVAQLSSYLQHSFLYLLLQKIVLAYFCSDWIHYPHSLPLPYAHLAIDEDHSLPWEITIRCSPMTTKALGDDVHTDYQAAQPQLTGTKLLL